MASYTMELRNYIEMWSQYEDDLSHKERIEIGRKKLFDFDYPLFNEAYKRDFETKFIRNFYMREIGFETEELFKMRLENWLTLNMPYFNQRFESELLEYDPLTNTKTDMNYNRKNDKDQTDVKGKVGNVSEIENGTQKSTSETQNDSNMDETGKSKTDAKIDETSETNRTLDRTQNTDGTSNSQTDTSSTQNESTERDKVDFNRELNSTTPDERLAITANDGTGLVNYASDINEKRGTDRENVSRETTGNEASETDVTTSEDMTGKDTEKSTTVSSQQSTSETDTTSNQQIQSTSDTQIESETERKLNRDYTEDEDLKRDIGEIEDFVQHRIGKIGINTYPQLIKEYRNAMLRIEVEIFTEMNRLFMLVY